MYTRGRSLHFESMEDRRLLSINWTNMGTPGSDDDNFETTFGAADAAIARRIVQRAIQDWENIIVDHNFDSAGLNNTFSLGVVAGDLGGSARGYTQHFDPETSSGIPYVAIVHVDNNGGGDGWFIDNTPTDDAEFTGIANRFQSSFVDSTTVGQAHRHDLYRTVVHEIGHALGLYLEPGERLYNLTTAAGTDQVSNHALRKFYNASGTYGVTATLTQAGGGHLYEGPADSGYPTAPVHPHDLMNDGRALATSISSPYATTRQWISDLDVQLLADAYGYTVNLPSTLATAHASLDRLTGTLVVQGLPGTMNDTISVTQSGSNIQVAVNSSTVAFPAADVEQIVIAGNGGTDNISWASGLNGITRTVHFVVNSNQDATDAGTIGDGVVDLDGSVPGSQTTLRGALQDIGTGTKSVYVPRGNYNLALSGSGGITQGDLDISGHVTLVGSGAGATIVNASSVNDRVFELNGSNRSLNLARLTITGGSASNGGGIYVGTSSGTAASLSLDQVAIVGNSGTSSGGGIYRTGTATATVNRSVFTGNSAGSGGGGAVRTAGTEGALTIGKTVFANNAATTSYPNVYLSASSESRTNQGYNLIDDTSGASTFFSATTYNDYIATTGSVDYVVTSLVDSFDVNRSTDSAERSLREAVDLANSNDNTLEEIWLPAWNFVLTRDRATYGTGTTDMAIAFGDLDISDSLSVRGVGSTYTSVRWQTGVDALFDLIGDFNGNGIAGGTSDDGYVSGSDFFKWQLQYGSGVGNPSLNTYSADGDDDGDVDDDDLTVWDDYYGNTLALSGVNLILA